MIGVGGPPGVGIGSPPNPGAPMGISDPQAVRFTRNPRRKGRAPRRKKGVLIKVDATAAPGRGARRKSAHVWTEHAAIVCPSVALGAARRSLLRAFMNTGRSLFARVVGHRTMMALGALCTL